MNKAIPITRAPIFYRGMPLVLPRRGLIKSRAGAVLQMEQGDRTYSVDANAFLSDGALPYTATGYAQYGGAQGIFDAGGNQNVTITLPTIADVSSITPQQARLDAVMVIDLTAITIAVGCLYKLMIVGSNNAGFTAGTVAQLGMMEFGAAASLDTPNGFATPAPNAVGGSRYEIPFCTEQNNVKYEYVSIYNVISGASASITYKAALAVLPEP